MKTNVNMIRKMGDFDVIQRTNDGYFDGNDLLRQWNKYSEKRHRMDDYLNSPKTKEFIEEINERECKKPMEELLHTDYKAVIIQKGRNSKNGKTPNRVWMSPLLFIDFAMSINPKFKYDVLKFVYDQLVEFRHKAGDNYNVLTESIAKLADADYRNVAIAIQWIVFNHTGKNLRQNATQEQLKEITDIESKVAFAIDMGFIHNNAELINSLRKMYNEKYRKF